MREPIDPLDPAAVRARLEAHRNGQERLVRLELIGFAIAAAIIAVTLVARIMDLIGA